MSRRRQKRFNGCRGKARFGTFQEARAMVPDQTPYFCGSCCCWHLTSQPVSKL